MSTTDLHQNHIHSQTHANRKCLLTLVLLAVFLALPQTSHEFDFGFGGGADSSNDASSVQVASTQQHATERKFKFHKIERIYMEDPDEEDDENDDPVDSFTAAADSATNDEEEYQFERVRRAQKDPLLAKGSKQLHEAPTKPFFGTLFTGWFDSANEATDAQSVKNASTEGNNVSKSNSIIDWLKWLAERTDKTERPEPEASNNSENLLSYFNRWPFNSLFPIGQPAKPIRMPRRSDGRRAAGSDAHNADSAASEEEDPMNQYHFESLLHTLPGFVANAAHVQDTECRQQLQIFQRQLRGHKLWTLQMLDATAKVPAGMLRGNINQFGDFEQCTHVKTLVKVTPNTPMRIRGKYCLAHIETQATMPDLKLAVHLAHGRGLWNGHLGNPSHFVPRYAVANWGICIPHMCSGAVVQQMLETNLRPYNASGVEFHVEVNDNDCYVRQSRQFTKLLRKDNKFSMTVVYISVLILLMTLSLFYEFWHGNSVKAEINESNMTIDKHADTEELLSTVDDSGSPLDAQATQKELSVASLEDMPQEAESAGSSLKVLILEVFRSFSPKRTLLELLSRDRSDVEFPILHVLKLGATFMLYMCLKFIMLGHLPISNRDKLVRAMDQPLSIVFRAPLLYADSLLLISGFLTACQLSQEMEHKSHILLLKRMSAKVARYLPAIYLVLFFQTWILPHLASGPLWTNLVGQNAQLCAQQMWRNVFSAQNAIDFEETCSPMTIQLGLEVQLYLLAPLIVWLYYTDSDAGFLVYGAVQALSVGARYSRTNREHLSVTLFHGMNVSKFYRTANILYSSPISRATPYLLGIGAGLLHRVQGGCLGIAPEMVPLGWILSVLSIFWCVWSPSAGMRSDFIYTPSEAAAYAAWSPLILGLALCWLILMFPKSEGSVLRFLTASRPMLFLSRICFPMQLVMFVVVLYNTASVKESIKYQISDLVNLNEIVLILVFGTALAFIIDMPSQRIRSLIVNRIFIERCQQDSEQEPISGAEPSEGEASEERSEHATSDTPEPPDNIWASDQEEEERNYVSRRHSSAATNVEIESATASSTMKATTEDMAQAEQYEEQEEEEESIEDKAQETEQQEQQEEDEESDISEADEVRKRPDTPPAKMETEVPSYRRRRRPFNED